MEYFDVLDEKGNKTGKVKLRSEVHRDGDFHRATHMWIFNSVGEVLLQKRTPQKDSYPNMWNNGAGGHVSAGEDSMTTAIREIWEEIGIKVLKEELQFVYTRQYSEILNDGKFLDNEFVDVYVLFSDLTIDEMKFDAEEVSELKFIDPDEYEKKIKSKDPEYIPLVSEFEMIRKFINKS